MENKSGFNLESALARWREEMRLARGMTADQVRELETHLRDSYARLEGTELTPEERFVIAQRRLGAPEKLDQEFQKLPPRTSGRPSRATAIVVWTVATGSLAALVFGEAGMRIMSTSANMNSIAHLDPVRGFISVGLAYGSSLAPLLVAAFGFKAVWAYLRARRQSLRVAIILAALFLPSLLGALNGLLWVGAPTLGVVPMGDMFSRPVGMHPMSLSRPTAVLASMFRLCWLALWVSLLCRELFLRMTSVDGPGIRERVCRALDAE